MRDAIDAGIRPTNHTDFVVAPLDQLFMLWSAVNRISRAGAVIGPDQRVTPLEGLKAMTLWAAEQYGEEKTKGTLEPGKLADLVILSDNPLTIDPTAIKDIQVLETLKEGKTIYKRTSSKSAEAARVTGTITYRERIAMPPTALIKVQLVDISRADAPAIVLGEQLIEAKGKQVPFTFQIPYDPATINPGFTYAIQARIEEDGKLRFINDQRYAVITRGAPTQVEMVLKSIPAPGSR